MTKFTIFQVQCDADLVNTMGWAAVPEYTALTWGKIDIVKNIIDTPKLIEKSLLRVADIEVSSLEEVFEATQNFNEHWFSNASTIKTFEARDTVRSGMVGDVFVNNDTGEAFLVLGMGFENLGVHHLLPFWTASNVISSLGK